MGVSDYYSCLIYYKEKNEEITSKIMCKKYWYINSCNEENKINQLKNLKQKS